MAKQSSSSNNKKGTTKKTGKHVVKKMAGSSTKNRDLPKSYVGEGNGQYRSNSKIRRLNMYTRKVKRDSSGNIVSGGVLPQNQKIAQGMPARIEPNRNWFQNTRVIGQSELTRFREALKDKVKDPYSVLLKSSQVPYALLETDDDTKLKHIKVKKQINFKKVFGEESTRKKANIQASSIEDLISTSQRQVETYSVEKDSSDAVKKEEKHLWGHEGHRHSVFTKGTSKRIWNELYKVVDSSDVIIQVLDARDPMGSRCRMVEKYLKMEKPYKHLIFVINKCDLVPTWVTVRWVKLLSQEFPTLAFHASITNPFGKGSLIQLLRQFSALHKDKKSISVGFVGYPNVGKSSIINTLKKKKVCPVASVPGETKVWQYVSLMSRIHLVDCPGVTYPDEDTDTELVLRGVVRAEKLPQPSFYVQTILDRVKKEYVIAHYGVVQWDNYEDFLKQMAQKTGKLLPGGGPDIETCSKKMIYDWQRGKIPWFVSPPIDEDLESEVKKEEPVTSEDEAAEPPNHTPFKLQNQDYGKLKVNSGVGLDAKDRMGVGYLPDEAIAENRKSTKASKRQKKVDQEKEEAESKGDQLIDFDTIFDAMEGKDEATTTGEPQSTEEVSNTKLKRKRRQLKRKAAEALEETNVYIPAAVLKRRKKAAQ
uniref:Nucleolar GTP-binding protein 2 n=1 Tax=Percolomonas cosmopolitus TaxID=63605 RepID=A0A7S1KSE3_9EUKA|eukprot:CAMPEP_0117446230 /NCGR_PEP_ID=MMETSP0759-20121206/6221_1 /TAXON_ID=63605 /ORGANISM="Percolomonas cosmopolitus, Strain WS" /LENGTH=647 /DNA_ID=CAMNT_0005238465 /DNA_START=75 /DNA_END=2018 /DNA_ORIENTATION=+